MNNEIDLWSLLKFYGKYWYVIILLIAAGSAVGFLYTTIIQTPLYKSDAKVTFINGKNQSSTRTIRDISNYADLVTSRNVLNKAIETSGQSVSFEELARATSVKNNKNTDVLDISVTTADPERSAALANGVVKAFEKEVVNVYAIPEDEVRVIDQAHRDNAPVNVRKELQLLLAAGAGCILALIVLFFVFDFKNSQPTGKREAPKAPAPTPQANDDIDLPDHLLDAIPTPRTQPVKQTTAPRKPGSAYTKSQTGKKIG